MYINIILDIDRVLACRSVKNIQQAKFFKNKGAILTAIKTHYIFPGVLEFVKLLFQMENVKVSFFSSAEQNRNRIFVDELLKLAIPESTYEEIRSKVRVLSRDDLTNATDEERKKHYQLYDQLPGSKQKNILKALDEGDLLENAVLIDDDDSFVACGQVKNFLSIPPSEDINFELASKYDNYQPDGYKLLRCVLSTEESIGSEKKLVKQGDQILIIKTRQGFEIGFLNQSGEFQREIISQKEHKNLWFKLNKTHRNNIKENSTGYVIEDPELIKEICNLTASFNGKMKKICRQANRIFYAAGFLLTIIQKAKANNISISESLFRLQFKMKKETITYKPVAEKLSKIDELYLIGLEKLKEVNNNLQLITPRNYLECVKLPTSKEEHLILQQAIENQDDGCCIM